MYDDLMDCYVILELQKCMYILKDFQNNIIFILDVYFLEVHISMFDMPFF